MYTVNVLAGRVNRCHNCQGTPLFRKRLVISLQTCWVSRGQRIWHTFYSPRSV